MSYELSPNVLAHLQETILPPMEESLEQLHNAVTVKSHHLHLSNLILRAGVPGHLFMSDSEQGVKGRQKKPYFYNESRNNWYQPDVAIAGLRHLLRVSRGADQQERLELFALHLGRIDWVYGTTKTDEIELKVYDSSNCTKRTYDGVERVSQIKGYECAKSILDRMLNDSGRFFGGVDYRRVTDKIPVYQ